MSVVHISEEEAARDIRALFARAAAGDEIVIDGQEPLRLLRKSSPVSSPAPIPGRKVEDILASLKATPPEELGYMDEGFAADVLEFREAHKDDLLGSPWD